MSTPDPRPIWQQRLPLIKLPQPSPPSGLGLGAPWQSGDNIPAMLERLRPAWWYDWRYSQCGAPGYVPMIWTKAIWDAHRVAIESLFARRPELFWLLLNEPERSDQADLLPETAANMINAITHRHDIQYAAPGVAVGAAGFAWLERYLGAGGPVPDMWHIHIYGCTEPEEWLAAWSQWRAWMIDHNVARPTIISETNGWTATAYGQQRVMEQIDAVLEHDDLLQAAAWFATRYEWGAGHPLLLDDAGGLTPVGDTFAALRQQS